MDNDFKDQAVQGGIRYQGYLSPSLAAWLLDRIDTENGFASPSEAAFIALQQLRDLSKHPDLQHELLRRTLDEAQQGPCLESTDVMARLREKMNAVPEPAIWTKSMDKPPLI